MGNEYIVIDEAVKITGKHITTIYKAIRRGKLTAIDAIENSKPVKKVRKSELIKLYGIKSIDGYRPAIDNFKDSYRPSIDDYRKAIEEVLEAKQSQLMKPIEEQALYRLGRIEQENSFLKAKVETLLQELEQYKSLPGPAELEKWQKGKADLLSRGEAIQKETEEKHRAELEEKKKAMDELQRKAEGLNQLLLDNANNIKELAKERETLQTGFKEQEATIKEKERALKELDELHRQELEALKKTSRGRKNQN